MAAFTKDEERQALSGNVGVWLFKRRPRGLTSVSSFICSGR